MKLIILTIAMVAISLQSFSQGIVFENLTYDQAIAKAKAENKMVLLDCYTVWCGPCKMMAEKVFTLAKAGDYFNPRYVSIKVDMEKGDGPELRERLSVVGYPTFIVADGDGNIIAKFAGGFDIDTFIKKVEEASSKSFATFNKNYENGKLSIKERVEYVGLLTEALEGDKAKKIANELFASSSKKEKLSKTLWPLYKNSGITYLTTESFDFLVENKKEFEKIAGKKDVDDKIFDIYFRAFSGDIYGNIYGVKTRSVDELTKYYKIIEKLNLEGEDILLAQCALAIARANNDGVKMVECIEKLMPKINDANLWSYTSSFSKVFENKPELRSNPKVKALGQILTNRAPETSKNHYKKLFDL